MEKEVESREVNNFQEAKETPGNTPKEEKEDKETFQFSDLNQKPLPEEEGKIDFILDIPLEINVELGRTRMLISDLLKLVQGSIIELPKAAGETLEIMANGRLIARGEVVVVNEKYAIRVTEIVSPEERIESLG